MGPGGAPGGVGPGNLARRPRETPYRKVSYRGVACLPKENLEIWNPLIPSLKQARLPFAPSPPPKVGIGLNRVNLSIVRICLVS